MMGSLMSRLLLLWLIPVVGFCQSVPPEIRDALVTEFHFSHEDFAKVESGKAVAHLVPTGRPDDVRMAGIILIKTSSDDFIKAFRDIEHFADSKEVVRTVLVHSPPIAIDFAEFRVPDLKKSDVLACHPGHCAYKVPADGMKSLQTEIDWNAPDAREKADAMIRRRCESYLKEYSAKGDSALAVYSDTPSPYSVAEGQHSLIGAESGIAKAVPDLVRYAMQYPADRPPDTEDFFYWQEAAFGLKHVMRVEQVMLQKLPRPGDPHYAIISKMLFATHYFRAAFEFQYVYPVRTPSGEPAIYLISAQRSYVDGLTGAKGAIIRKIAEGRSPAGLAENLQLAKQKLEWR
jgi:hypothetical protein